MKSKIIIGLAVIFAIIIVCVVWMKGRNVQTLKEIDASDISAIHIYYAPGDIEIKNQDDIDKVMDLLHSMELNKGFSDNKDGFLLRLELLDKAGEKINITVKSKRITIDGKSYKCDRDYCDDFQKLYEELKDL